MSVSQCRYPPPAFDAYTRQGVKHRTGRTILLLEFQPMHPFLFARLGQVSYIPDEWLPLRPRWERGRRLLGGKEQLDYVQAESGESKVDVKGCAHSELLLLLRRVLRA